MGTQTLVEFHIDYEVRMPNPGTKEFSELLDAWIAGTRYGHVDGTERSEAEDVMDELADQYPRLGEDSTDAERYNVELCQHLAEWVVETYAVGDIPPHVFLNAIHYHTRHAVVSDVEA